MKEISTKRLAKGVMFFLIFSFLIAACKSKKKETEYLPADTLKSGTINISIDESFKPVMDEEIKVFEGTYQAANITPHYKPEADCLKDFLRDTGTRMVIVTRGLTPEEARFFKDSSEYGARWDELATDAIAVVLNNKNNDTLFSKQRLQDMLSGKAGNKYQMVFDGLSATSIVRFAIDSILQGRSFDTSVVRAVKSSQEVLDYIAATENAIGFVGISWIGNPEDRSQVEMLKKVKLASLKCSNCVDSSYVKPSQYSILTRTYPLVRGLYYILKENYAGLGSGFLNFLQYERGQLIFKRAYLGSSKMGFGIRNVQINEKL